MALWRHDGNGNITTGPPARDTTCRLESTAAFETGCSASRDHTGRPRRSGAGQCVEGDRYRPRNERGSLVRQMFSSDLTLTEL